MNKLRHIVLQAVIIAACCLIANSFTWATTYYVATAGAGGSDANSCPTAQTDTTGKLTINAGISCLASGDTLQIKAGTYTAPTSAIPSGSDANNRTKIESFQTDAVTVSGTVTAFNGRTWIWWDDINVNAAGQNESITTGGGTSHIKITNSRIYGAAAFGILDSRDTGDTGDWEISDNLFDTIGTLYTHHGIYLSTANNVIEFNEFTAISGNCVQFYTGSANQTDTSNSIARFNNCHDTSGTDPVNGNGVAINAYNGTNIQIYGNLFTNIGGTGTSNGCCGVINSAGLAPLIYNNTVTNSKPFALSLDGSTNAVVKNNIFWDNCKETPCDYNHTEMPTNLMGTTPTRANNLCTTATTGCSVTTDPKFINAAENNYQIQNTSPARDGGADLGSSFNTDYAGTTRPRGSAWDIGAYEHTGIKPNYYRRHRRGDIPSPAMPTIVSAEVQ